VSWWLCDVLINVYPGHHQVVSYTGGNRGQPTREVLENPCAENFILFHIRYEVIKSVGTL
jgi:hypothetical protein